MAASRLTARQALVCSSSEPGVSWWRGRGSRGSGRRGTPTAAPIIPVAGYSVSAAAPCSVVSPRADSPYSGHPHLLLEAPRTRLFRTPAQTALLVYRERGATRQTEVRRLRCL